MSQLTKLGTNNSIRTPILDEKPKQQQLQNQATKPRNFAEVVAKPASSPGGGKLPLMPANQANVTNKSVLLGGLSKGLSNKPAASSQPRKHSSVSPNANKPELFVKSEKSSQSNKNVIAAASVKPPLIAQQKPHVVVDAKIKNEPVEQDRKLPTNSVAQTSSVLVGSKPAELKAVSPKATQPVNSFYNNKSGSSVHQNEKKPISVVSPYAASSVPKPSKSVEPETPVSLKKPSKKGSPLFIHIKIFYLFIFLFCFLNS